MKPKNSARIEGVKILGEVSSLNQPQGAIAKNSAPSRSASQILSSNRVENQLASWNKHATSEAAYNKARGRSDMMTESFPLGTREISHTSNTYLTEHIMTNGDRHVTKTTHHNLMESKSMNYSEAEYQSMMETEGCPFSNLESDLSGTMEPGGTV